VLLGDVVDQLHDDDGLAHADMICWAPLYMVLRKDLATNSDVPRAQHGECT
jgi:hypothetical protein